MKKALLTDLLREIKRSRGRFISIFAIVALGCGFFSGVKATMPDMVLTAENYFRDDHLMDIKLQSSIGIKSEDVTAVRNSENVELASAGYSKDVFYTHNDQNYVIRTMSVPPGELNKPIIIEGRLPEKSGECVVEKKTAQPETFRVGEKLTFTAPSGEELGDTLAKDTYEVVGVIASPLYIGYERGTTSLGSGEVTCYVMLPEEDYVVGYYTELYVRFEGLTDLDQFSEEYTEAVNERKREAVEAFHSSVTKRYDKLKADAGKKISSAEQRLLTLESLLTMSVPELEATYTAASAEYENGMKQYEAMTDKDSAAAFLLTAKLEQAKEQLGMLSELINGGETAREKYRTLYTEALSETEAGKKQLEEMQQLSFYEFDRFSSNDYASYKNDAEKVDAIAKVFPAFFLLIAALVTLTTMTRMIDEQRTTIGTYKALGYSAGQMIFKYLSYAFIASVLGSIIGTVIGLQVFPSIIYDSYKVLYNIPEIDTPFRPLYMLGCAAASLLCTGGAVLYASLRALRSQPSELMRPRPPASGRRVLLERAGFIWNRMSFLMKVTVRNLLRYKKRFFMTVAGVAGCTALIITGFGLKHSILSIVDKQFDEVMNYDAVVVINSDSNSVSHEALSELRSFSEVGSAVLYSLNSCETKMNGTTQSLNMIVPEVTEDFDKYVTFKTVGTGEKVGLSDDSVVITEKLSMLTGVKAGDDISVSVKDSGKTVSLKVGAVVKNYALHYLFITPSLYRETFGSDPLYKMAYVNLSSGDEDGFKAKAVNNERFLGISLKGATGKNFLKSLESLDSIVLLLIVCAGLLAVIVLYNLANINITERVREIATIKVLGFYDGETSAYIYRENIISTVTGILVGMGLGRLLHYFVVITSEVEIVLFNRELIWWADIFGILLTVGFALAVNIVLHFKLRRIDMVESLKSIE